MKNIDKYKDEIKEQIGKNIIEESAPYSLFDAITKAIGKKVNAFDLVDWLCSEYKEPLLTDEEKEYLQDLMKWYTFDAITVNYVYVNLLREVNDATAGVVASVTLPSTLHSVPFTHLDCGKIYTLEELGL